MIRQVIWTPAAIGTLRDLWTQGKTASEIAQALGDRYTRNAVIGKAHRLGLEARPSPIGQPQPLWRK